MSDSQRNESVLAAANAIDLASRIVLRVAGTNSAATVNGAPLNVNLLNAMIAAKLQRKLAQRVGVVA